jgi:hypothetical protein
MSVEALSALIVAITGLVAAVGALLHSIQTRKQSKNAVPPKG